jgi:hypothetical protein
MRAELAHILLNMDCRQQERQNNLSMTKIHGVVTFNVLIFIENLGG